MTFLTEERRALQASTRTFVEREVLPHLQEWEDADMGDPRRAMREQRYREATGRALAAD